MSVDTHEIIGKAVLETLEQRRMMTTVTVADGTLVVQGSSTDPNNIHINSDGTSAWVVANGETGEKIAISSVRRVRVIGGEKDDSVAIDPSLNIPVYVQTGNGDDHITTGGGNDTI